MGTVAARIVPVGLAATLHHTRLVLDTVQGLLILVVGGDRLLRS
jgi:hypothetical protein